MHKDFREFIASLNSNHVEYVIVGGYAMAFHGIPRYTGDIDFLIRVSPENAVRLERALRDFGFASVGLGANDFLQAGRVVQLGFPPHRIDILTSITGVEFDEIWQHRVVSEQDGLQVSYIDRESFIKNKRATGRARDRADLEALGEN
jgi:hypothetical protein